MKKLKTEKKEKKRVLSNSISEKNVLFKLSDNS